MLNRFGRLPLEARRLLELASCVGDTFDVELLRELTRHADATLESSLYTLADAKLIVPCDTGFRFAHDRIREAAQSLLSTDQREALHHEIGRLMLERTPASERPARALEIAEHLDRGLSLLSETLRPEVIDVNLLAAKRALSAGGASAATRYLGVARELFSEQDWSTRRNVGFELHLQSAESAFQGGDPATALALLEGLDQRQPSNVEYAQIAIKRMQVNALMYPPEECMRYVLSVLRRFGVRWPLRPSKLRVALALLRVRFMLRKRHGRDVLQRATSVDPQWLALVLVLGSSASTTTRLDYNLSILATALVMRRNVRNGYIARPAFTMAAYAAHSYLVLRDPEDARRRAAEASLLEEQSSDPIYGPRMRVIIHGILYPWLMPRREALEPLERVWEHFRELGDSEYAYYARFVYIYYRAIAGDPLAQTEERLRELVAIVDRTVHVYRAPRGVLDAFLPLRHGNPDDLPRTIARHDSEIAADTSGEPYRRTAWLITLSFFDRHELAFAQSEALGERLFHVSPFVHIADHMLHRGIAAASLAPSERHARRRYRRILRSCRKLLHRYAKDGVDFQHMAWLLDAEHAAVQGHASAAQALYRRSAERAIAQTFPHHAALAHERRGRLLIALRRHTEAAKAFAEALALYREWGAQAKVEALDRERAALLT
jgi:histidine kinase